MVYPMSSHVITCHDLWYTHGVIGQRSVGLSGSVAQVHLQGCPDPQHQTPWGSTWVPGLSPILSGETETKEFSGTTGWKMKG